MKRIINYKIESLKINPNLKASKVKGCAFYHIIEGHRNSYKPYSKHCDTVYEAWKDCYENLNKKQDNW